MITFTRNVLQLGKIFYKIMTGKFSYRHLVDNLARIVGRLLAMTFVDNAARKYW